MTLLGRITTLLSLMDYMNRAGSGCTEEHIQHFTLFFQIVTWGSTEFPFECGKYGPVSPTLHEYLMFMRADAMVKYQIGPPSYVANMPLGTHGKKFHAKFPDMLRVNDGRFEFITQELGAISKPDLEILATALYATVSCGESATTEAKVAAMNKLRPIVTWEATLRWICRIDEILNKSQRFRG